MRVLIFGATGMVGQGVLRECLLNPDVEVVASVGRTPVAQSDAKLRQIAVPGFASINEFESQLRGFDACFFCAGVSVAGLTEAEYTNVTYNATVNIATLLARLNPHMTFIYVSGARTDSTEHGRTMWARVKGKTENALLRLPFKAAYMFRPALIQPMHGTRSKTRSYRIFYDVVRPVMPILRRLLPRYVTTTERVGRAMLRVAKNGYEKRILENEDINRVGAPI